MNKRNAILAIVLLLLSLFSPSYAQIGGGFSAGYRFGIPKWKSYRAFAESYEAYYKDDISSSKGFGPGGGYAINGDMTAGAFVVGIRYSHYGTKSSYTFKSGGTRHFDAKQNLLALAMGFGYQASQGHVNLTMALISGNESIDSYYEYTNGVKSHAGERALNGKYSALRLGWSARVEFSIFCFYAATEYVYGKIAGTSSPLDDSFTTSFGLPTNYGAWVQDPISYGIEDYVLPNLNGLRFEVGLRLNLSDE